MDCFSALSTCTLQSILKWKFWCQQYIYDLRKYYNNSIEIKIRIITGPKIMSGVFGAILKRRSLAKAYCKNQWLGQLWSLHRKEACSMHTKQTIQITHLCLANPLTMKASNLKHYTTRPSSQSFKVYFTSILSTQFLKDALSCFLSNGCCLPWNFCVSHCLVDIIITGSITLADETFSTLANGGKATRGRGGIILALATTAVATTGA